MQELRERVETTRQALRVQAQESSLLSRWAKERGDTQVGRWYEGNADALRRAAGLLDRDLAGTLPTEEHDHDQTPADTVEGAFYREVEAADYPAVLWSADVPFEDAA